MTQKQIPRDSAWVGQYCLRHYEHREQPSELESIDRKLIYDAFNQTLQSLNRKAQPCTVLELKQLSTPLLVFMLEEMFSYKKAIKLCGKNQHFQKNFKKFMHSFEGDYYNFVLSQNNIYLLKFHFMKLYSLYELAIDEQHKKNRVAYLKNLSIAFVRLYNQASHLRAEFIYHGRFMMLLAHYGMFCCFQAQAGGNPFKKKKLLNERDACGKVMQHEVDVLTQFIQDGSDKLIFDLCHLRRDYFLGLPFHNMNELLDFIIQAG